MVDWLELSQTSGSGDTQILVRAFPNYGDTIRGATLVLSGLTKHVDITAQQDYIVDEITISPDIAIFRYTGGTTQFSVLSKTNWEVNSSPNWLSLSTLSGNAGTTLITATAQANSGLTSYTTDLVVCSTYGVDSAVVTLEGAPEILEVSPTTFENIPSSGGTYQFTIASNADWTITPLSNNSPLPLYFSATAGTPGTNVVTVTAGTNVDFERTSIFRVSGYQKYEDISFHQEGETDYFRMVVTPTSGSGNIRFVVTRPAYASVLSYRKNLGDWTTITATTGGTYIRVNGGDTVEFIGNNNQSMGYSNGYNYFSSSGVMFDTEGNIMSLISSSYTLNTLYASFKNFFKGCTGLRKINSTWGDIRQVLDNEPFLGMYANCTNLIYAENALPNAELGNGYSRYAYYSMFEGCTKLTHPPIMYTTGFTKGCCYQMFKGCTSLVEPVTFSPNISFYDTGCFESMYEGCTSLKTAPELPATTLTEYCYNRMFAGCTSLTSAPELPATTLTKYCYYGMFAGCSSLTTAPALPASTMTEYCYTSMFQGCTSLTSAPALPATTLATDCYNGMFMGCTSLTTAPQLPATTLTSSCYAYMFSGCTSLTTAPVLPATALTSYCYREMFNGCTRLDYIKCLAIYNSAGACTAGWVVGVAPSGTFVKDSTASWTSGTSGIPNGWTVINAT